MKELIKMLELFDYSDNQSEYVQIAKGKYDINIGYWDRIKRVYKKLKGKNGRFE